MSTAIPSIPIGKLIEKVVSWNPPRDAPDDELDYIDLSSVDNITKQITANQTVIGRKAPSRARQRVKAGDILVSTVRPNLNGVARVPEHLDGATASTGFCVLRPLVAKLDASYLFHWVQSASFVGEMVRKATGASYPAVSDKIIAQSEIPLPPLNEQKRVAAILDQADELRRKRQRTIDLLNQLGQAIFHEMLLKCNRNKWTEESLSEFCDIQVGFAFKSSDYTDDLNAVKLCRGANVLPGRIDWRDTSRLPDALAERHSEFFLQENDVVIAMDRPWISEGFKTAMVGASDLPALLVQRVARLRAKSANDSDFLHFLVNSREFQSSCHTTETTIPHISPKDIRGFNFLCPPEAERTEFSKRAAQVVHASKKANESFAHSVRLFSSLQYRAFQGEL